MCVRERIPLGTLLKILFVCLSVGARAHRVPRGSKLFSILPRRSVFLSLFAADQLGLPCDGCDGDGDAYESVCVC